MPETIEDYYARVMAAADDEGRLAIPVDGIPYWEIFPFEAEGLRLRPIEPLADAEEPRHGEDPEQCHCAEPHDADERSSVDAVADAEVWRDDHWRISVNEPSGAPLILMLSPQAHHDFTTLPRDRAAEMGQIMVALGAAMEALPSVARVHVSKWGDGGAHAHIFFFARPTQMPQLRGTMMAVWDHFLPRIPVDVRDANARAVIQDLVRTYGGRAVGRAA
jgi:diadenosine tetraphosphate (Ap4A) HIT family hydrolase